MYRVRIHNEQTNQEAFRYYETKAMAEDFKEELFAKCDYNCIRHLIVTILHVPTAH